MAVVASRHAGETEPAGATFLIAPGFPGGTPDPMFGTTENGGFAR